MNEILQQRIEEAAEKYANSTTSNLLNVFETTGRFEGFEQGATFALRNQWISVEEALPPHEEKENELVFGCVNDEGTPKAVGTVYYDEYGRWHYADEEETSLITHWMPIPKLGGEERM